MINADRKIGLNNAPNLSKSVFICDDLRLESNRLTVSGVRKRHLIGAIEKTVTGGHTFRFVLTPDTV